MVNCDVFPSFNLYKAIEWKKSRDDAGLIIAATAVVLVVYRECQGKCSHANSFWLTAFSANNLPPPFIFFFDWLFSIFIQSSSFVGFDDVSSSSLIDRSASHLVVYCYLTNGGHIHLPLEAYTNCFALFDCSRSRQQNIGHCWTNQISLLFYIFLFECIIYVYCNVRYVIWCLAI